MLCRKTFPELLSQMNALSQLSPAGREGRRGELLCLEKLEFGGSAGRAFAFRWKRVACVDGS